MSSKNMEFAKKSKKTIDNSVQICYNIAAPKGENKRKGDYIMKKSVRVLAFLMLSVMVLSLVACSSFGSIKKSFLKHGYTYIESVSGEDEESAAFYTITAEMEKGNASCSIHLFKTEVPYGPLKVPAYAMVLEFDSDDELKEYLSQSETLKGFLQDAQQSEYINGNCLLVPLSPTKYREMIDIFNESK